MKAIILAAGKGNRLKTYTEHTPKPLVPIGHPGSPHEHVSILEAIIASLPSYVDEVVIIVGHLKEQIEDFISQNAKRLIVAKPHVKTYACIPQTEAKGTHGALLSAKHLFNIGQGELPEQFLVLGGDDIHSQQELEQFISFPRCFGVQHKTMPGYKSIIIDETNTITELRTQTPEEREHGNLVATGAYLIDTGIFDFPPEILIDGEIGLPQTILKNKDTYPIQAFVETAWMPVNDMSDLEYIRTIYV